MTAPFDWVARRSAAMRARFPDLTIIHTCDTRCTGGKRVPPPERGRELDKVDARAPCGSPQKRCRQRNRHPKRDDGRVDRLELTDAPAFLYVGV